MASMILLGEGGSLSPKHIIAVASAHSAPIKRMLKMLPAHQILDLTYGYPRNTVVILDNGMLAITSYTIDQMTLAVQYERQVNEDEAIPF